jgi:N-sulfoglucosamine sulfohydrolase
MHSALPFILILLGISTALVPRCLRADSSRPNFIFFITDDISAEDIGPYGNRNIHTPNLDRMAAESLVFERAYLVTSSCSPSRCSIITGRYPHNHGAPELHMSLPSTQKTFTRELLTAGYHTILSGKNHMGTAKDLGFEKSTPGKGPGGSDDWVSLLRDRPQDRPFFAWFASLDAHRDWQINSAAPVHDPAKVNVPPYLFDGPETRDDLAKYYHEVSRSDAKLGELLEELDRQGIANNTYVIYCSDNGRPFPRCKTRLYESGVQTPLLIRRPGHISAGRTRSLVSSIDFAPTFLELAGVAAMPSIQGVSFAKILRDPSANIRDYAFSEHNWHVFAAHERSVRYKQWIYIRNAHPDRQNLCLESNDHYPAGKELWEAHASGKTNADQQDVFLKPRPAEELYDATADPHQLRNLAGDPRFVEELKHLGAVLTQWTKETGDTVPEKPTPDREGKRKAGMERGELPGASADSDSIAVPGPILRAAH